MNENRSTFDVPRFSLEYRADELERAFRIVQAYLQNMNAAGAITATGLNVSGIASGAGVAPGGLSSGDVWRDTTTNTLKVVP